MQRGTELMNNLSAGLKHGTELMNNLSVGLKHGKTRELVVAVFFFSLQIAKKYLN